MLYSKLTLLFSTILIGTSLFAQKEQSLIVSLKSGTQICIAVAEKPIITFNGTIMNIGNGNYQIENVQKWEIGYPNEFTQNIDNMPEKNRISYKNGVLTICNKQKVQIYNTAGIAIPVNTKNGQIDLTVLPQDTYVVKVGNETLKIYIP